MQAITKVVLDVTLQVLSSVYTVFIVHCVIVFFFNKNCGKKFTRKQPIFILHAFSFCERHFWLTLQKQVAQNVSRVTNSIRWWFGVENSLI